MTPAERLLAAADLLEKRAGEASDGPWTRTNTEATGAVWIDTPDTRHAFSLHGWTADATYIATMHPEVGKALALVFRMWAKIVRLDEDLIHRIAGDETLALADLLLAGAS